MLLTHVAQTSKVSDEDLVRQSLQGSHEAFGTLVTRYQRRIVGLTAHMIGDFHQAEDLAQEAFVRAFRSLDRLRDPAKFSRWVGRIASHVALDHLRRRKARPQERALPEGDYLSGLPDRLAPAETDEMFEAVRQAALALPEESRTVLAMRQGGMSYAEIAKALQVNESQVKGRLHRARTALRAALGRYERGAVPTRQGDG
ncbi:MAG: RNA polymerase sigma factor [Planctomycetota bacterium]